jgi:hypothetical protein
MSSTRPLLTLLVLLTVAGCQSQGQILASDQDVAIQTAERRGKFELSCPAATGEVLSSNMLQPVLWGGEERAEYTVGVSGCGKRATYMVICPQDSTGCFAGSGRDGHQVTP